MAQTQEVSDLEAKDVKKSKLKVPEGQMEPMTIKVESDLKEHIQAVANQDGKTPSEVCREILEKSLSGDPDRQRAALLRSLAITKEQLKGALDGQETLPWFKQGKARRFRNLISAIEDLEDFLKEA